MDNLQEIKVYISNRCIAYNTFFVQKETVWQAYHSPASLGFPLSSHRRVDGYKIFHLKQSLSYHTVF